MAKFLSRLFSSSGSSSSKRGSFHGSHSSITDGSRRTGGSSGMRTAASMENLASYHLNQKTLEKHKLHKASWEGNLNKVERHARPGQIDAKEPNLPTPLHLAVVRGHLPVVKYLVQEGAKLNVYDNEQRTPLVKAVLSGRQNPPLTAQICATLLNGGADSFINAVDSHGKNALHYAIETGNEDLVALFLSAPACDPNFRDYNQMTPLHLAVNQNNPNIVFHLLSDEHEHQADPNLTDRNGQTPLHTAANLGHTDMVRVILQAIIDEPCDPTIVDAQQLTAYQIAKAKHHETCAKLIDEYEKGWIKLTPRREAPRTIHDQEIKPSITNPSQQFHKGGNVDDDDDETSDDTSSNASSHLPDQLKQQSVNQWPGRTAPSVTVTKPETRTLADLMKSNPLQPDPSKINITKPNDQAIPGMMHGSSLQSDPTKINPAKPTNQTVSGLMQNIPLRPTETASISKPVLPPTKQPSSIFGGIGSASVSQQEVDHTSISMTIDKPLIAANPLLGQTTATAQKNPTLSSLAHFAADPVATRSDSWSPYSTFPQKSEQGIIQAKRVENWDESSTTTTTQSDDDDTGLYRTRTPPVGFAQPQNLSSLNGTAVFTTTQTPANHKFRDSDSDEDSIEAAVQKLNPQKASGGIQNLVNQQIGDSYKVSQPPSFPSVQSPLSEDSSWTNSSVGLTKPSSDKGVAVLVQQQPIMNKKSTEMTWDDSRPLSADLKRTSVVSTSSDESDGDDVGKSSTIVKSPLKNNILANLVQTNIQPTESKPTGVENLTKIIDTIMHMPAPAPVQKQPTPPSTIGKLTVPPLIKRSDSMSSNASSSTDEHTPRRTGMPTLAAASMKQQPYLNSPNQQTWPEISSDGRDFTLLTRKYSNEMIQPSQRPTLPSSIHPDFNNLRGSMSSSTSSIQNNMERISELKEDIKQIERKQEDSLELKRQLKEMENKKNNFEALYKKNDQLLRETETKLEKEINEKQRLEWASKNLNMELKSVKQKLQALEDEKDILNQRCLKLKEERDNYDDKLRVHQANALQSTATGVLREEDIEKIKLRHREEMKLLSAENEDLHQRTKQLQSDLQLHKESLDVTIRYKIDLEKALEEKTFLQHELDRLKHERDFIEQEKSDYKSKYDNLQDEIRILLSDRSKVEQKLNVELQEQIKQRQRSTDDMKKYKTQIEQLNIKLGDAEARLLVLQTQNEALIASKDREIKNEFESLTHRLNVIESEKLNAEQRYHNENKEIANKQQHVLHEPLMILTPSHSHQHHQHSPSSPCTKCDTLQRSYEQEREHRLQTEKDNERLRDVVSRQKQHQASEQIITENSKQMRSETERVKYELDRLRHDFDKLVLNYEPSNNLQQQAQLHSQIDTLRQFYEDEFRRKQLLTSKLTNGSKSPTISNEYHRTASPSRHDHYDHSHNGSVNCSICSNSRLLKERLENAIDVSLADQRIQTIKQIPILPRQTSPLLTTVHIPMSSVDLLRKRYYI